MSFAKSIAPYFDDFDVQKNFAQVLFKPGVAVQTRELNQLQSILQNQIQRFGDHVLKQGTIVSGGQINLHPNLPYVKILDNDPAAAVVDITKFYNYYVKNSTGVIGLVVSAVSGKEATAPNLNTLYVKYLNGGTGGATTTFAAGQVLTIYNPVTNATIGTVTVAGSATSPIGNGYGISIEEGVVYHAGYFTRTSKQFVVVSKYSNAPDQLCVGYDTAFSIVNSDDDPSLLDNTTGTPNANAPGADRLKAVAFAHVLDKITADQTPDFLSIIEFSAGQPYKLEPQTQYNTLEQHLAQRTFEESGDYVVDQFLVTSKSGDHVNEDVSFNLVVDPGVAYVRGHRVATDSNFVTSLSKGTTVKTITAATTAVDYGGFVNVSDYRGSFDTLIGALVDIRSGTDTAAPGAAITANGTVIGQARVKAFIPTTRSGTNAGRLYLFDIKMSAGKSFASARSIQTAGLNFTANIKLQPDSTATNVAVLQDANKSSTIFSSFPALKSAANVSFTYAKTDWGTLNVATTGSLTLTVSGSDLFESAGAMTRAQLDAILVSPSAGSVTSTTALTGTVATTNASTTVTGTGTLFLTEVAAGQSIIVGTQAILIKRVISDTSIEAASAATATVAATTAYYYYPRYTPIQIISGTVASDRLSATLTVTKALPALTAVTLSAPIRTTPAQSTKAVTRNAAVRLNLSNNVGGVNGPWSLGIPDAIHLRGVYKGANTTFTTASAGITDVTNEFFVDANHQSDTVGLSYLYQKASSTLNLATTDRLLVVADVLTTTGTAVRTISSYPIDDDLSLASSSITINTMELPEVFGTGDQYYDVRDSYDFRPIATNTVSIVTDQATAPINPAEATYATQYSSVGTVPLPGTLITANIEQYLGRKDRVVINTEGKIIVIGGQPGTNTIPAEPKDVLTINILDVPPYPSLPLAMSATLAELADTKIANEKISRRRRARFTISTTLTKADLTRNQPKGYTMKEIGAIDRRLANVEYYVALTQAETRTQNRSIPSANDPSTDRFKFGFFTDGFVDNQFADILNPQYRASIADGVIKPRAINTTIRFQPLTESNAGGITTIAYSDYPLVEQLGATSGAVIPPAATAPVDPIVVTPEPSTGDIIITSPPATNPDVVVAPPVVVAPSPIVVQSTGVVVVRSQLQMKSTSGSAYETFDVKMSASNGPVEMYFNARDVKVGIEVYQGTSPGFAWQGMTAIHTIVEATALTTTEKTTKAYDLGKLEALNSITYYNGFPAREDAGKILFTHNAAAGQYYTFVVRKFKHSGGQNKSSVWAYRLFYPTDSVSSTNTGVIPMSFTYDGVAVSITPSIAKLSATQTATGAFQFFMPDQAFDVAVVGLKPNTIHSFSFDGVVRTTDVFMPSAANSTLMSDSQGNLSFTYYHRNGATGGTEFTLENLAASNTASSKIFTVYSSDYTSLAIGSVSIPSYLATLQAAGLATLPSIVSDYSTLTYQQILELRINENDLR